MESHNGYGDPPRPYGCDDDGDGANDSWCSPITIDDLNDGVVNGIDLAILLSAWDRNP